jgi:hypothetical protein
VQIEGHYALISPYGRRGSPIGRWYLPCPALASTIDGLVTRAAMRLLAGWQAGASPGLPGRSVKRRSPMRPPSRTSFQYSALIIMAAVNVSLPTKFEMAVNLKTAKALGLAVPPSILLRADEAASSQSNLTLPPFSFRNQK